MIDLSRIQAERETWATRNFPDQDEVDCILGMSEEMGELCHAFLKRKQGIRGTRSQHTASIRDAIGDLIIYALGVCDHEGWQLEDVIMETWHEVHTRDWVSNQHDGS